MKLKYEFVNGDINVIEVDDFWGNLVLDMRKTECNSNRKERYYCFSYDAEDKNIDDFVHSEDLIDEYIASLESENVKYAFSKLTSIQQRRLIMLADGLSVRKIAELEGIKFAPCLKSIELAKKKFKKFFENGVSK